MNSENNILKLLKEKSCTKQKVYKITKSVFAEIQDILSEKAIRLNNAVSDPDVDISYEETGDFDAKLKFSGDTLLFNMHTNIFDFDSSHQIHKTSYVKEDKMRSFCGVINIYNFLSDSLKYNRLNDAGFLIARIFINKDNHFFVEGDAELGFLFNDLINQKINKEQLENIINSAIEYSLNFDLQTPDFNTVKMVSVHQIIEANNNHKIKTSKRLGFKLSHETNNA
ncbi:MAG: hypothetical protein CMD14_01185 [Flavobacteriales bacterium]|nr:hypothetical protein [Flavobacteriales bacterium]|tara:strand:+ start:2015 stop:2689 length:675 start_codon:yes stop_codon:yes gene_type:complete